MSLLADELRDLRLNTDREVYLGSDNDLEVTSGIGTVEQSVVIHAGDSLRDLVGQPVTGQTLQDVQAEITKALRRDPQVAEVQRVSVNEVNRSSGEASVTVFVDNNNEFEIGVSI